MPSAGLISLRETVCVQSGGVEGGRREGVSQPMNNHYTTSPDGEEREDGGMWR